MPYSGRSTIEDLENSLSNVSAELREAGEEVTRLFFNISITPFIYL